LLLALVQRKIHADMRAIIALETRTLPPWPRQRSTDSKKKSAAVPRSSNAVDETEGGMGRASEGA
jgi:hypothetical protein